MNNSGQNQNNVNTNNNIPSTNQINSQPMPQNPNNIKQQPQVNPQYVNQNQNIPINEQSKTIPNVQMTPLQTNIPVTEHINEINQNITQPNIENNNSNEKHNYHQEQNLKEVNINDPKSKKESNTKYILTIILFIVLFGVVYFLPEISSLINLEIAKKNAEKNAVKITTGTLKCKLSKSDKKFDYSYTAMFNFENNKLKKLVYTSETKGDQYTDKTELSSLEDECQQLEDNISDLSGIAVSCSLNKGTMTKKQTFNYSEIQSDEISSEYAESGGTYPEYALNDNIDKIEKNMKSSGYECERIK